MQKINTYKIKGANKFENTEDEEEEEVEEEQEHNSIAKSDDDNDNNSLPITVDGKNFLSCN